MCAKRIKVIKLRQVKLEISIILSFHKQNTHFQECIFTRKQQIQDRNVSENMPQANFQPKNVYKNGSSLTLRISSLSLNVSTVLSMKRRFDDSARQKQVLENAPKYFFEFVA